MTDSRVQEALKKSLEMGEVGVQVAAYLGNELIVDTWAGVADKESGRAVDGSTLFIVFSVTKAVTATALHIQAERGLVEYDAPVARYWPEYGANGKAETRVRDVLTHRAGVPGMPAGVTPELMCDWDWMVAQIEAFTPTFEPGTKNAYHELIWGWMVGEIVHRTDPKGRSFGQFVQEEICEPLDIDDLYLGLPSAEFPRVAPVVADWAPQRDPDPLREAAMPLEVYPSPAVHNRRDVQQACYPGGGGIMNARSCARFFALIANGGRFNDVRLLSQERVWSFTQLRDNRYEVDAVLQAVCWIGVGGYWVGGDSPPLLPIVGTSPHILHHPGIGGSIGWADLDTQLSVAICHNWMHPLDALENPLMPVADAIRTVAAEIRG